MVTLLVDCSSFYLAIDCHLVSHSMLTTKTCVARRLRHERAAGVAEILITRSTCTFCCSLRQRSSLSDSKRCSSLEIYVGKLTCQFLSLAVCFLLALLMSSRSLWGMRIFRCTYLFDVLQAFEFDGIRTAVYGIRRITSKLAC